MQNEFDVFIQINTLFKVPLELKKIGLLKNDFKVILDKSFFEEKIINHFKEKYPGEIIDSISNLEQYKSFPLGKSVVYFPLKESELSLSEDYLYDVHEPVVPYSKVAEDSEKYD